MKLYIIFPSVYPPILRIQISINLLLSLQLCCPYKTREGHETFKCSTYFETGNCHLYTPKTKTHNCL